MKQNSSTMTKTIGDTEVKHKSLDTGNKFLNPIWMWGQNTPDEPYIWIQSQNNPRY